MNPRAGGDTDDSPGAAALPGPRPAGSALWLPSPLRSGRRTNGLMAHRSKCLPPPAEVLFTLQQSSFVKLFAKALRISPWVSPTSDPFSMQVITNGSLEKSRFLTLFC